MKRKYGEIRDDGMVFVFKNKRCTNGEYWVTQEHFMRIKEKNRLKAQKNRKNNPMYMVEYRKRNQEKLKNSFRKYRISNLEKTKQNYRDWASKNSHAINAKNAFRRAKITNAEIILDEYQKCIIKTIYSLSKRISRCLSIKHHVDHIIPLTKKGLHIPINLQVIPAVINIRKSNKIIN
jgi:hypothetical protein